MFKKFVIALVFCTLITPVAFSSECHESIISTDAVINREVIPDTAKISFTVENSGLNLNSIKEKNDKTYL